MSSSTHSHEKHLGPAQYVMVWVALLVLTAVTVAVWKTDLSYGARVALALLVATAKATLVAVFFMHLWEEQGVARLTLVVSGLFVILLIGLTLADNATRFPYANPPYSITWKDEPWQKAAPPMQAEPPPIRTTPANQVDHPTAHKP